MSKPTKARKIRKDDYTRVVITETAPYETPIIFSTDGLYEHFKKNHTNPIAQIIKSTLICGNSVKATIPYTYRIRKDAHSFRSLSVIHPSSHYAFIDFYKAYGKLICHYGSKGNFSIRAPYKIASTVYYKGPLQETHMFKGKEVSLISTDETVKHSASYFAYSGYDRIYKFYNSGTFLNLEKNFSHLNKLDVSRCFDSIYTHSISWATKSKEFVKANLRSGAGSTFGEKFDSLMRQSNHNETSGIIIGPEASRLFAEIILQDVDCTTERQLASMTPPVINGADYTVKRYVDDIFIFTRNKELQATIGEVYRDNLSKYNLHENPAKSTQHERPFFSAKSRVIRETNSAINRFCAKFLSKNPEDQSLEANKKIYHPTNLIRSFIDSIKVICSRNEVTYEAVSSYVISAFTERTKRLIKNERNLMSENLDNLHSCFHIILNVAFFFYSTSPSVTSSYKLSTCILLISRHSKKHLQDRSKSVNQKIFELIQQLLDGDLAEFASHSSNFVHLESINILLSSRELGVDYLLPTEKILATLDSANSYFGLMSCLYYVANDTKYASARSVIVEKITEKLRDLGQIKENTELACLFLDSLACPYIEGKKKAKLLRRYFSAIGEPSPKYSDLISFLESDENTPWFINWQTIDLLSALEKKELKSVY